MIVLEIDHDTIIMPQEFPRLGSLDDIVSRVIRPPLPDETEPGISATSAATNFTPIPLDLPPQVVRFFQRIFRYCHTAAHLNKALTTLESRLTPMQVECLYDWHRSGQLIPSNAATKFHRVLTFWFQGLKQMMSGSGKSQPEPFVVHRISYTLSHFVGPGSAADKTLLVCFSNGGGRNLGMPNAVLMQHTDSTRHDLLIVSEPLNANYQQGVPGLGKNLMEVIEALARREIIGDYRRIRTFGWSAGGYAAMLAGHLLGAELAVSVGGRFPSKRKQPLRILRMILAIWRVMHKGHCAAVLVSYAADNSRDRKFARIMTRLFGSHPDIVKVANQTIGHSILGRLVERGELTPYLARTAFAELDDKLIAPERRVLEV